MGNENEQKGQDKGKVIIKSEPKPLQGNQQILND